MKQQNMSKGRKSKVESRKSKSYGPRSSDSSRIPHSNAAFTLMELLVVLAVIGLLMGLLFPALMSARQRAKITRARSEIQTLQQAWLAYWNVYGQFPGYTEMDDNAVKVLGGENIDDNNPQEIAFMEFDDRHRQNGFRDPWLENNYKIELDSETPPAAVKKYTSRVHLINTQRYRY